MIEAQLLSVASQNGSTSSDLSTVTLIALVIISLAIGLIGGLVGIALGVIRLPALTLFGVDPLVAASANLIISAISSVAGSWPAIFEHRVAYRVVILLGVPAFIGSFIGGWYADVVPRWVLLSLVAVFLVWSALSLIFQAIAELKMEQSKRKAVATYDGTMSVKTIVREGSVGMAIGLVGGAIGLALGVLRMPALIKVLKMDPGVAGGTNLVITVFIGLSGFAGHIAGGRNDWTLIAVVGTAATVGMFVGSKFTYKVEPTRLRLLVGVVCLVVAPVVLWDAFTQ